MTKQELNLVIARWLMHKIMAFDAEEWITVHPGGKGMKADGSGQKGGTPVLIDGETGEVKAGMGGKFNGYKIGEIKKDFVGPKATVSQIMSSQQQIKNENENKIKPKSKKPSIGTNFNDNDNDNNFKSWYEDADIPEKVDGQWIDLETGIPYKPERSSRKTQKTVKKWTPESGITNKPAGYKNFKKIKTNFIINKETDKAVMIQIEDKYIGKKLGISSPKWVPKSAIHIEDGKIIGIADWVIDKTFYGRI